MKLDRAEGVGIGAALTLHVALVAALSLQLARMDNAPEPPAITVEFVDEIGLAASAPDFASAPPPAEAEPIDTPTEADAPPPEPVAAPSPNVDAAPPPRVEPSRPVRTTSRRPTGSLDNLLEDVPEGETVQPGSNAPVMNAAALGSIQQAIRRQVQPCANRQVDPSNGEGANQIRVTVNLVLTRSGSLARPPRVVRTQGVTPFNEKFEQRVRDMALAVYRGCSPLRGLPPELYQTPNGGWSNINMTYRLP